MKLSQSHIRLKQLHFYAYHGVLPQERQVGGEFLVDADLTIVPNEQAFLNDRLEGTVDYAEAYRIIEREMATPSALLEHVCQRIASHLMEKFPQITSVLITVCKASAPIGHFSGKTEVELFAERNQATNL